MEAYSSGLRDQSWKLRGGSDVLRGFESHRFLHALVVKLADTHDLGSCDASRESSNLSEGTKKEILQMNAVTEPSPWDWQKHCYSTLQN